MGFGSEIVSKAAAPVSLSLTRFSCRSKGRLTRGCLDGYVADYTAAKRNIHDCHFVNPPAVYTATMN